ncbi:MAG: helix-turn-helix domain-containing protein [Pseudomonadota bacterium]|nr:helix-turn-helix domain-containing protein [Pseudomonadota bacterium]
MASAPPAMRGGGRCEAFRAAMDVLGKPWNGLLLKELEAGALRFSVLAERMAPIGDRMLSCRLKELEAAGLVSREVDPGPPVRVSYALTEVGRGIGEVTRAVEGWGAQVLAVRGEAYGGGVCPEAAAACDGGGVEVSEGEACPLERGAGD